jgi:hypothetical protein
LLAERPGSISVLTTAASEEPITLEAGGQSLDGARAQAFWSALAALPPPEFIERPQPPRDDETDIWLVFGLPEGRAVQLRYQQAPVPALTDALGAERYAVSPELRALLATVRPSSEALGDAGGPGSLLWWPLMLAAGLACIGLAIVWSRWQTRLPSRS